MEVFQTNEFKKTVKKLHANQNKTLDEIIKIIQKNPVVGEEKIGDLAGIRVYKHHILKQLVLIAYKLDKNKITLMAIGTHQNFYRDLKK